MREEYCKLLGVRVDASIQEIRMAYYYTLRLRILYILSGYENDLNKLLLINEAYKNLSDTNVEPVFIEKEVEDKKKFIQLLVTILVGLVERRNNYPSDVLIEKLLKELCTVILEERKRKIENDTIVISK